jgi:hypothetical protein
MSKTLKHIYTKLNENTVINFWSADILTLIDTYFDAGKITQKPVKAVDGLKETYTTVFKDQASFDEFLDEGASNANLNSLQTFCDENEVKYSIEVDGVVGEANG